jgi:hypothetical protein
MFVLHALQKSHAAYAGTTRNKGRKNAIKKKNLPSKHQVFPNMLHYFPARFLYSLELVTLGPVDFGQFQSNNYR